jgi:signal transduction histidine kinase
MRLPGRLLLSYAMVIAVGAVAAYVTIRLLAPKFFAREAEAVVRALLTGNLRSRRALRGTVRAAFVSALTTALLFGTLASVVVGAIAAALITRRLVRPLNELRQATRLIAAGRYQASVPVPREPELAGLASDVNTLATRLADTEERRSRLLGEVAHEMRTPLTALEGYLEGIIADTGAGLAAADLERVFERFYRVPGQPRRAAGSGIGLTIARNIARAHGGDVTAGSGGPGHGATFTLTLPLRAG